MAQDTQDNAINGSELLVLINDTVVGYQRDTSMSFEADEIEASNKNSGAWAVFIQGRKSGTGDMELLLIPGSDFGIKEIWEAFNTGTIVTVKQPITGDSSSYREVKAFMTSNDESYPDNDIPTVSVSYRITGAPTLITPS